MELKDLNKKQLIEAAELLGLQIKNVNNTTAQAIAKVVEKQARREGADIKVLIEHVTAGDKPKEETPEGEKPPALKTSRPRTGVGRTAWDLLKVHHSTWNDEQILVKVKEAHPKNETTKACIAWYRAKMRREGVIPKKGFKHKEA